MKKEELVFCPLGGSGEIGANMNLYSYGTEENKKWIIVDMGVTFADDSIPGIDLIYADPGFVLDKKNCLVIDFGTATTFDIISKKGIYEGGVIAPGVNLSIMNLNKFTASLPILKLRSNAKSYGKNTKDALNAGFIWGYQGLINNIIKKITLTRKTNYKIILTGGYASLFKKYLTNKPIIDQNITIKGIARVYKELLEQ